MNKLTIRAAEARARMKNVRERGFRNVLAEDGAIDLASIMVGVLVIGIVGGVIAATVFAVIPWSQDEAAKSALSAVSTAESVALAQSSGNGSGAFLPTDAIFETDGLGGPDGLLQESDKIIVTVPAGGKSFAAFSLSDTGAIFGSTSAAPSTVTELSASEVTAAGLSVNAGGELVLTP